MRIHRNILLLGCLSLFNDVTADMITPLLPAYLAGLGAGASFLGAMEGVANSVANMTTLFAGWQADRKGRSRALTVFGYRLSTVARLLLAIPHPAAVFTARTVDRLGKGIHTAPRDQIIAASVDRKRVGEAFGIQRMMDHAGSLLGPLVATGVLALFSVKLPVLFLIASVPAILSVLIIPRFLKVPAAPPAPEAARLSWKGLPKPLKTYAALMFLSALTTPSELFLIMKMKEMGLPHYQMPLAWFVMTFFSLIATYLGGRLSDAWSRRRTIALGWILFAAVYVGFALNPSLGLAWALMAGYGFHTGLIEPAERAYPALIASGESRASAIGWYYFSYGMGLLPASLLFGLLWDQWGPKTAFLFNAALTLAITGLLVFLPSDRKTTTS